LNVASSNPVTGVAITVTPADNNGLANGTTSFARTYNSGAAVTVAAPATVSGNNFQKWQKDGVDYSTSLTTNVTMDVTHTLTAVYVTPPPPVFTLNVASSSPTNGVAVTVSPTDNNGLGNGSTAFSRSYNSGTSVSLTAPSTAGANNFKKWQLDGVDFSTTTTASFSMNSNHTLTAVYLPTRVLTVTSSSPASGVSITVSPADKSGSGTGSTKFTRSYLDGTVVTLTAPATAGGNNFIKWQKDGVNYSTALTTNLTMDANHTMKAVY
jgi:hypothetical protein